MRFKFSQGANLFSLIMGLGLLALMISLLYLQSGQPQTSAAIYNNLPTYSAPLATISPTPLPALPPSLIVSDLKNGHWYEGCKQTECIRGRWIEQQGMFQQLDGSWTDFVANGYQIYAMAFETDLTVGTTYSVCDMPGWNTIWWHHEGDQHTTKLEGCMVVTYEGVEQPYRLFTEANGTRVLFDQVSFNAFPYVAPVRVP